MAIDGKTLGLALSGGGYRATLFGLGSLWRLNDAGLLGKLDRVTSVSGGSIVAGVLANRWRDLQFTDGKAANFVDVAHHDEVEVDRLRLRRQRDAITHDRPALRHAAVNQHSPR